MRADRSLTAFIRAYDSGEREFRDLHLIAKALHNRTFADCAFSHMDFDGVELLDVAFVRCTFSTTTFRKARFYEGTEFIGCSFDHVEFTEAELRSGSFSDCTFAFTTFTDAAVWAVQFSLCTFSHAAVMAVRRQLQRWKDYDYINLPGIDLDTIKTFAGARLEGTDLRGCIFEGVSLSDAQFEDVHLADCKLSSVRALRTRWTRVTCDSSDFDRVSLDATLILASKFSECTFTRVTLIAAELDHVSFGGCFMEHTDISRARLLASDLEPLCESRRTLRFSDPPIIDWRSVCRSIRSSTLHLLLVGCGMPDIVAYYLVDAARAVDPDMLYKVMRSTFISYGAPDREFAAALREALEQNGVRTFFFDKDAIPGERLHRVMHEGVNKYDRVILICSEASLVRPGVKNEIEETLAREARDGGASYLIPVARDTFVFKWNDALGFRVRDRVVADFTAAAPGSDEFTNALQTLLAALRTSPAIASGA